MTNGAIPSESVEAAARAESERDRPGMWEHESESFKDALRRDARLHIESAAPYMLADALEDAANTAQTDELTTAAEVIYDLRARAKDLRAR